MTTAKDWERQADETDKAFEAFIVYRDLPPSDRSLAEAAKVLGKSTGTLRRWHDRFDWRLRAEAWTDEQDRVRRDAMTDEIADMGRRQAQQAVAMGNALMVPVRAFLTRLQRNPETLAGLVDVNIIELAHLALKASIVFPTLMKAERLARGVKDGGDTNQTINITQQQAQVINLDHDALRSALDAYLAALDGQSSTENSERPAIPALPVSGNGSDGRFTVADSVEGPSGRDQHGDNGRGR